MKNILKLFALLLLVLLIVGMVGSKKAMQPPLQMNVLESHFKENHRKQKQINHYVEEYKATHDGKYPPIR